MRPSTPSSPFLRPRPQCCNPIPPDLSRLRVAAQRTPPPDLSGPARIASTRCRPVRRCPTTSRRLHAPHRHRLPPSPRRRWPHAQRRRLPHRQPRMPLPPASPAPRALGTTGEPSSPRADRLHPPGAAGCHTRARPT
ncbi:hypothetical protein BS78_07G017000 [Paspalum vaginatum]|nr:hypothetical protein BS78_07G017000 [Paspalum vaginatum]